MYEYYQISAEDLGKDAKIPVLKLGDSGEVFYEMALEMVNTTTLPANTPCLSAPLAPLASIPSLCAL